MLCLPSLQSPGKTVYIVYLALGMQSSASTLMLAVLHPSLLAAGLSTAATAGAQGGPRTQACPWRSCASWGRACRCSACAWATSASERCLAAASCAHPAASCTAKCHPSRTPTSACWRCGLVPVGGACRVHRQRSAWMNTERAWLWRGCSNGLLAWPREAGPWNACESRGDLPQAHSKQPVRGLTCQVVLVTSMPCIGAGLISSDCQKQRIIMRPFQCKCDDERPLKERCKQAAGHGQPFCRRTLSQPGHRKGQLPGRAGGDRLDRGRHHHGCTAPEIPAHPGARAASKGACMGCGACKLVCLLTCHSCCCFVHNCSASMPCSAS